ncbi:MAG: ABC transporter substrate-binding protein [Candidatus Rokubacteria bacterium]|nr:ABC transporter substrate-binding protein [Candidatus Rokubacteria bacterium]
MTWLVTLTLLAMLVVPAPAAAQERPRSGGELLAILPAADPPSYDAHREDTFAVIHPAAPHYNTLLRIDPADPQGAKIVGDLAESWTVSSDGRVYTVKLRRGVRFHDGSEMTSRDVKASYDKIVAPPAGVTSARKGEYVSVAAIETPDAATIVFRLKWSHASFASSLASPWNWIYKADLLAKDIRWYEKNVMGTGPFTFVEHVKGSHWLGKKNASYWDRGKPYLDGYRFLIVRDSGAQVAAIRGERAHIQFRGFSPAERDTLVQALGPKVTLQESSWNCHAVIAWNHEKPPFNDRRVRRALTLAIDRYDGSRVLSKITPIRDVAGLHVPGSAWATPPDELAKLAGYGRDINAARAEARRLLKDAGVADGFAFTLLGTGVRHPFEPLAVWLIDQWRTIGVNVKQDVPERARYFEMLRGGNYQAAFDPKCGYVVEPDLDIYKFQSGPTTAAPTGISDANYARYKDPVLDDLYVKQSRARSREERMRHLREFERRLLDEEAHYAMTLQWHRIVPHSAKVRGWTATPSHYLNHQLDTVWLAE